MDFKERFKGRTSIVTKEGIVNNLAAPNNNPVLKATSNAHLFNSTPVNHNQSYSQNSTHQRFAQNHSPEGKPPLPNKIPTQSQFRSQAENPNINTTFSSHLPNGIISGTPGKTPYFVQNPLPHLDEVEGFDPGYNQFNQGYVQQGVSSNHWNVHQSIPSNQFNPNSFYNQHSQYKGGNTGMSGFAPKKENREIQSHYGALNSSQQAKKNFESLTQQNRQKRLVEEALRGFENHNNHQQFASNSRYGEYNQGFPTYNGFHNRPALPGYNGPRESHSNPPPYQHQHQYHDMNQYSYNQPSYDIVQNNYDPYREGHSEILRTSSSNKTGYKPYNLRDYKEFKTKAAVQLGGLGPNINTTEWQKEKEKRDKMAEFSQNVKAFNSRRMPSTETSFKPRREKEKERSRREIALDFARNIPAPKIKARRENQEDEDDYDTPQRRGGNQGINGIEGLDEYERRHLNYMAQLERIKFNQ